VRRPSTKAPWWLFVLAASYLAYFGLLLHSDFLRLEPPGVLVAFRSGGMMLQQVMAGSAAAKAGLQSGDIVVSVGGRQLRRRQDWTAVELNLRAGTSLPVAVIRSGEPLTLAMTSDRTPRRFWRSTAGLVLVTARATQLATLLIALLVAFKRPRDPLARLGAWLLASGGVFSLALPAGMAATWRSLPTVPGLLMWVPFGSSIIIGAILFTFFAVFPRPLIRSRMGWAMAWTPMVVVAAWFLSDFAWVVYRPNAVAQAPDTWWLMITGASYSAAGLVALAFNYARLEDVNDRRRVRVILPGSVAGLTSGIVMVVLYWGRAPADLTGSLLASPVRALGIIVLLALPVSFAYAILRRRMFDLTTLLRQGVRYALARRVVLSVVPLLILVLLLDLTIHQREPLGDIVSGRLTTYMVLIGLAVFAAARREHWLTSLDRRFFRETYDAHRLVRQLTDELRDAGTLDRVGPAVVARLEAALHPRFCALMLRAEEDSAFRTMSSAPLGAAPPPIPADWKVVTLARVLDGPLLVSVEHEDHFTRQLPRVEHEYLGEATVEVLLPVDGGHGTGGELMIVLGPRRSEEPYGQEDLHLLTAVADALALVLRRSGGEPIVKVGLEECPACGRCYDSGTGRCPEEQQPLERMHAGRLLANRYRLDRRLAQGGMGKLYEAADLALERQVAVKVLRDEWTRASDAPERFQREARAAASFAHPNVVTVYDFGVSSGRGFLVMELLRGRTLRGELHERRSLSMADALSVLHGVCAAVEAAHDRGLIHRDLKPENIFIVEGPSLRTVKVLDFGLAKSLVTQVPATSTGAVLLGTPVYMAPEQLRGEGPSRAWDLFALAVLTYEMLTGALPFAASPLAVHGDSPAIPLAVPEWPELPAARLTGELQVLQPFFAAALSVQPSERPQTARAFIAAFEREIAAGPLESVS
jgi:eukaryotic-like serine/threonine-protein kinase